MLAFTPEETRNGSVSLQNTSRNDRGTVLMTRFWILVTRFNYVT